MSATVAPAAPPARANPLWGWLRHLAARGLPTAMLYVDADNKAAVSVYERLGFVTHETDLMYRTET